MSKADKILSLIYKLNQLNQEELENVNKAIDSCILVQILKELDTTTLGLFQIK